MNIPEARERADSESLEMLVDFGRVCLRRRRMQAAGGSKSDDDDVVVVLLDLLPVGAGGGAVAVAAAVSSANCSVVAVVGCSSVAALADMEVGFSVTLSDMM